MKDLRRLAEIASWILESKVDTKHAAIETGIPAEKLERLIKTFRTKSSRAFMQWDLSMVITAMGGALGREKSLNFVQVGANDGKSGDPIYKHILAHGSKAILIEPQPWLIERIKHNYRAFTGQLSIENIAIGPEQGELTLYILKQEYWDAYEQRFGQPPHPVFSSIKEQVLKRIAPRLGVTREAGEALIKELSVPMKRLEDVVSKHAWEHIDVLQVDCEGLDIDVIMSLGHYRPTVIHFESMNLTTSCWKAWEKWARDKEYGYIKGAKDTLAIRHYDQRISL